MSDELIAQRDREYLRLVALARQRKSLMAERDAALTYLRENVNTLMAITARFSVLYADGAKILSVAELLLSEVEKQALHVIQSLSQTKQELQRGIADDSASPVRASDHQAGEG
jgi:hypothetical protein